VDSETQHPAIAFSSWSGGKDSCLALYLAEQAGFQVDFLLNMLTEDGQYSRSHGLRPAMLARQAEAMDRRIVFGKAGWENYEMVFSEQLAHLKSEGVGAGVFGDIDLAEHRDWVNRVCGAAGLKAVLPLWEKGREQLLETLFSAGFQAVIVCVKEAVMSTDWLGRKLDRAAAEEFKRIGIDLCGEEGEYHTFVYDGPMFHHPVSFAAGAVQHIQGYAFVELTA
jgi:uncharacterized protein (TIGR00290 family)